MTIKSIFLAFAICTLQFLQVNAQENGSLRGISIRDIYILPGVIVQPENTTSAEKFQDYLPQSGLIKRDLSNFEDGGSGNGTNISGIISLMAGFGIRNSEHSSIRIGASVFTNNYVSAYKHRTITKPADTLTSAQTGEKFYLSQNTTQSFSMHSRSINLISEIAHLYSFFPQDRISFFTGIGIGIGVSVISGTDIYYSERYETFSRSDKGKYMVGAGNFGDLYVSESIDHKSIFGINVFIPVGLDFRLGENGLLYKTHLIYEFRPVFNAQFGGLGDYSGLQTQHNFGIKYALNSL